MPVMVARKSPNILARTVEGKRLATTNSIEIKEMTAGTVPDLRYFLPSGRESEGDCCFLPNISRFIGFYAFARGKEGKIPRFLFLRDLQPIFNDERAEGGKILALLLDLSGPSRVGFQSCRR